MLCEKLLLVIENNIIGDRSRLDRIDGRQRVNDVSIRVADVANRLFMNRLAVPTDHLAYSAHMRQ